MSLSIGQRLFAHGGVYGLSRLVNTAFGLGLVFVYGHYLGEDYGIVALLGANASILSALFLQGMHSAWFRLRFDQPTPRDLHVFETTIFWHLVISITVAYGLLSLFGAHIAPWFSPGVPFFPLLALTALATALNSFPRLVELKFQAEQRPLAFAAVSLAVNAVAFGMILIFVAGLKRGVRGKIEADVLAALVAAVLAFLLIRPGRPTLMSRTQWGRALRYGLPLVPHTLAGIANNVIDRVLLSGLLGKAATGVYAMGYNFPGVGLLVSASMNQAFAPLFVHAMKDSERLRSSGRRADAEKPLREAARAALMMVALACSMALGITAFSREILLLLPDTFASSWRVIAPLSLGMVAWVCYFPFSQSIIYHEKAVRKLPLITILAAMINVDLNIFWIPRWGVMGAAWATLASNAALALLALRVGQATTPIPHLWRRWLMILASTAVFLALLWLADDRMASLPLRVAIKSLLAGIAILALLPLSGFRARELLAFLPGRRK